MPAPDPEGFYFDDDGRLTFGIWWHGNRKNRFARYRAIARNLRSGDWRCRWCCGHVPLFKRSDARFCCEGCRKKHARWARRWPEWRKTP